MALVLMYHNIVESKKKRATFHPAHRPYVVTRDEFTRQVETALDLGWRFLGVDDLYGEGCLEKKALFLTFDDSWENHCATDVMEERGIRGLFFLNSGDVGLPGRLTAGEIAAMAARGHEIGSHGVRHEFLSRLEKPALRESLAVSKRVLQEMSGRPVRFLSAPGGRYNSLVKRVAREVGYEAFFVSWPGFLGRITKDSIVKRIAVSTAMDHDLFTRFLESPLPLVLRRTAKYRLRLLTDLFTRKSGGEGH